jgi:hypothetical protein
MARPIRNELMKIISPGSIMMPLDALNLFFNLKRMEKIYSRHSGIMMDIQVWVNLASQIFIANFHEKIL